MRKRARWSLCKSILGATMGNFMRLLSATALGAVAGALIWAGAADATVYAIEGQDIPPATISGTITTDGTLGALTLANIIGIDLTVSDGSNTVVLTIPYALVGSSLAATSAGPVLRLHGGGPPRAILLRSTPARRPPAPTASPPVRRRVRTQQTPKRSSSRTFCTKARPNRVRCRSASSSRPRLRPGPCC
jgi:hypothetical protein